MEGKKYFGSVKGWILLVFYAVGFLGLHTPLADSFNRLTPFLLCFSLIVLLTDVKSWNAPLVISLLLTGVLGFFAEVLGVNTGVIFGQYHYGTVLGPKWAGTPLVLGVNWLLLTYAFSTVTAGFVKNNMGAALCAGAFMTGLDFLIEPVAVKLGWWSWNTGAIPWLNYFSWFLVSTVLNYLLLGLNKGLKSNVISWWTVVLQLAFFTGFRLWP